VLRDFLLGLQLGLRWDVGIRTKGCEEEGIVLGAKIEFQGAKVVGRVRHVLRRNEALDVLGNLHRSKVLVVHAMKAQAVEEMLHFGLDRTVAENSFFDDKFKDSTHYFWQRFHLISHDDEVLH